MPRLAAELGALAVSRLVAPGRHAVGGVTGLLLDVSPTGARSWILRVTVGGKRREIGLGGYPDVTMADARTKGRAKRVVIESGVDPVVERQKAKAALIASRKPVMTFAEAAEAYLSSHKLDDPISLEAEGLLLHPQVGGAVEEWMDLQGHRTRFKTVDLTAGPGDFKKAMRKLVS